ncbi:receptor-type tyrosine-protein phosphatase F-like [Actinia tenebrosa]|uniref:Receptor-type tyrosine-protein phosphatase F-like n=1 Tax=Actinia tenebrosa TaxID=6105 RepID=A0A6P8H6E0_ACTTE|nr:receptor-type tyrosine-protein phosphatase F-like [Actinia tenebrosa]
MNISVFYQEAPVVSAIPQQRSIQLSWTIKQCNPADPITGFVISNGIKDPLYVSSSDRQYTLLGLKPYTEYNVRVLARTQRVNGSWSETTKIKTKEDAPSAPVNVTGTLTPAQHPLGPSVVITWDRPREPNGVIRKYTIVYYYNKDTSNNKTVTISASADLIYSINVTKNGILSYKISATTVKEGPYADGKDIEYGCPEQSLVGKERNLKLSDSSYTASSYYKSPDFTDDVRYKPHNAKLNGRYGWASSDNNNADDYLQIDLGTPRVINAVATQGNGIANEWVTKYKLYLATNNMTQWYTYKDECGNLKFFKGNTDSNSVVRHDLTNPQLARYIRFVPVNYQTWKTIRVNVYVTNQEPPRMEFIPNKRSITLTWTYKKCSTTDHITGYLVKVENRTHKAIGDDLSYNVTDLKPYTEYNVSIKAIKQVGHGVWSNVTTIRTAIAEPESIASLNATIKSSETILLKWKLQNQSLIHGQLKGYRITYTPRGGKPNIIDVGDVGNYTLTSLLKYTTYVITIALFLAFSIFSVKSRRNADENSTSSFNRSMIAGFVAGFIVLVLILIVVITSYKRRNRNRKNKHEVIVMDSVPVPLAVIDDTPVPENNDYIDFLEVSTKRSFDTENNVEDHTYEETESSIPDLIMIPAQSPIEFLPPDKSKLTEEFKGIPVEPMHECKMAKRPTNKIKNRYKNIVAYDHSLVTLESVNDDQDSCYINASFIRGYDGAPAAYIATQGPLNNTLDDFWRMIWDHEISSIIMLTNLLELAKRKCHQYWPDKNSARYSDIIVTNHKTEVFADFTIRTFFVSKDGMPNRKVLHFHFTAWPDKGLVDGAKGDYINASFVHTYREHNAFIMTQAPMENTIADFWRMVMDYEIGTIVMLNNLEEECESFPQYWPQHGTKKYGDVTVELVQTKDVDNIIARQFEVTKQGASNEIFDLICKIIE